jgi:hypothetical protein
MADASRPPPSPPAWSDVFAALPQETPPASRWPQIEARLDAHRPASAHGARRIWPALAAGLCALALLPFAWRMSTLSETQRSTANGTSAVVPTAIDSPSPRIATDSPTDAARPSTASSPATAHAAGPIIIAPTVHPRIAISPRTPTARREDVKARIEPSPAPIASATAEDTLESLYAASAQLETLLTLTRDTRMESGPAAALANGFDAQLATIDARLAEPGLDRTEQRTLWRARVETLQDANSFETHQRLLSAEGRRYEGALVSVD